jgi:hypothetical protein
LATHDILPTREGLVEFISSVVVVVVGGEE